MQAVMILRGNDPTWAEAKRQLGEPGNWKVIYASPPSIPLIICWASGTQRERDEGCTVPTLKAQSLVGKTRHNHQLRSSVVGSSSSFKQTKQKRKRDFPGGPVIRTALPVKGNGFNPSSEEPTCPMTQLHTHTHTHTHTQREKLLQGYWNILQNLRTGVPLLPTPEKDKNQKRENKGLSYSCDIFPALHSVGGI